MNRYSNSNHLLNVTAYGGPALPFMLLGYFYPDSAPFVHSFNFLILWLVGLGVGYLLIAVHELGHAFVGYLAGIEIKDLTIGHWRKLFSFSIQSVRVTVRAAPSSGYVSPEASLELLSGPRVTLFLLAGVFAELGLLIGVACVPPVAEIDSLADVMLAVVRLNIFCMGGLHILVNLWPHDGVVGTVRHPTDGKQLLSFWQNRRDLPALREQFQRFAEVNRLREENKFPEARDLLVEIAAKQPENLHLQHLIGAFHCECGEIDQAIAVWR